MPTAHKWPKYRPINWRGATHLLRDPKGKHFVCGNTYDPDQYTKTNLMLKLCSMCKHAYNAL